MSVCYLEIYIKNKINEYIREWLDREIHNKTSTVNVNGRIEVIGLQVFSVNSFSISVCKFLY